MINGHHENLRDVKWKFFALVESQREDGKGIIRCGGALIKNNFILTAAHCIQSTYNTTVKMGNPHIDYMTVRQLAIERILHDDEKTHDIALLRVIHKIYGKDFGQIDLVDPHDGDFEGLVVESGGFGKNEADQTSDYLKLLQAQVIPNEVCKNAKGVTNPDEITNNVICSAATEVKDSICSGDGGSPLVYWNGDEPILIGINKTPNPSCSGLVPMVSLRISSYVEWIETEIYKPR